MCKTSIYFFNQKLLKYCSSSTALNQVASRREDTVETHYFISSLESNAKQFGNSIRSHWGIENSLDWILDVALGEKIMLHRILQFSHILQSIF
jgi:predicted transposase YbfD/YdcC